MISGTIVGDVGFVEGTEEDIAKVQGLRLERCRISEKKHAAGDQTRPEEYRDITMLYFEGEGDDPCSRRSSSSTARTRRATGLGRR